MAWQAIVQRLPSMIADADLTDDQFRFVRVNDGADGNIVRSDDTDLPIGVLYNQPDTGEAVEIAVAGAVKVEAGENLDPGDHVGSLADGTAGEASNEECAIVLEGGDTGSIITVMLGIYD